MNDALKKVNQERGKRVAGKSGKKRGKSRAVQKKPMTEPKKTGGRSTQAACSAQKRRRKPTLAADGSVSATKSLGAAESVRETEIAANGAIPLPNAEPSETATVKQAAVLEWVQQWQEADGTISPAITLYRELKRRAHRARRRWRHIRREQAARRFPESNRLPVQSMLLLKGMTPMLGAKVRERTWGRRKRVLNWFGHLRTQFENHIGRKRTHPLAFLGIASAAAVVALFFSFYTLGTTVSYDGNVVAKVSSELAAKDACADLEKVTRQTLGGGYSLDDNLILYSMGLMARKDVVNGDTFEEELSDDIGLVTYGYALYVDGELIGATPYEGALEELLQQLKDGVTDENTISCDFAENVEVKAEYVPTEKIMNLGYLAEMLYSTKNEEITYTVKSGDTWSEIAESNDMTDSELLAMNPGFDIDKLAIGEVLTISAAVPYLTLTVTERERYVEDVPYEIEYTDSEYLYKGDDEVLSAGKNGSADVVANVVYVNGEETERTLLSYVTLVDPVTEQQARGTKERPTWLPTGTFRWPCSGNITSRFGYRNLSYSYASKFHKGIDIANRCGTAICAADGGTVVYAGWMSGYGYLVQIDHGNGYVTYYGHNSSLLVSVGQHVYKGQQISCMGSTGNSTGNHCHFEVRYQGTPKNPLNYLP